VEPEEEGEGGREGGREGKKCQDMKYNDDGYFLSRRTSRAQ